MNVLLKSALFSDPPDPYPDPPAGHCYQFEFTTLTPEDQIVGITYDNGTQTIAPLAIDLGPSKTEEHIRLEIGTISINFNNISVTREKLADDLFHYIIIFGYPQYTIDILDISGQGYVPINIYIC